MECKGPTLTYLEQNLLPQVKHAQFSLGSEQTEQGPPAATLLTAVEKLAKCGQSRLGST